MKKSISLKPVLISVVFGFLICILLLLISAFVILKSKFTFDIFVYLNYVIFGISSIFSGFVSGFNSKNKGLIYGFLSGSSLFILFFILSTVIFGFNFTTTTFLKLFISLFFGSLGGILGVNCGQD